MKRLLLPSIAAFLPASLIAVYFLVPPYLERRTQSNKMFTAFDHLQAAVDARAGLLEYKHRLVEAIAAMERMQQLDADFTTNEIGKPLTDALGYYQIAVEYTDLERGRAKSAMIMFSEVGLHPPDESDVKTYRDAIRLGISKPSEITMFLEPWLRGSELSRAMLGRAAGHLSNAQIHAGRKRGELYNPPPPREEAQWEKLLHIEHPLRAADLEAQNAPIRAAADAKRGAARAAAEAHRRLSPLHVHLKALYYQGGVLIWIDGKKREYDFNAGDEEHIHANQSVEIESFYALSIPLDVSVNGKPWDVQHWSWVESSRCAKKHTTITIEDAKQLVAQQEAP